MTDQQLSRTGALAVRTSGPDPLIKPGCIEVEIDADAHVIVETYDLLAMIDRADPGAMRAYLRERSDYLDSPDESCSMLEDMLPADLAAEAARFRVAPEDVDEHAEPDPIERRLYVIDRLARSLRAGTDAELVTALADWVLGR